MKKTIDSGDLEDPEKYPQRQFWRFGLASIFRDKEIPQWLLVAARMSRFPHYWIYMAGLFSWGWLASGHPYDGVFALWALWFAVPGNFFYCAINDAFDQEQDAANPRKRDLEGAASESERRPFLLVSLAALATSAPLLVDLASLPAAIFLSWVLITVAYNVPPLRFKRFPVLDILFGGVGQCATVALLGYVLATGFFPAASHFLWFYLFTAVYHLAGAAFDAPFDRSCGLCHTTALIGTVRRSLRVAAAVAASASFLAALSGNLFWAAPPAILAAYALVEAARPDVETDTLRGFRRYTATVVIIGLATGACLYWLAAR